MRRAGREPGGREQQGRKCADGGWIAGSDAPRGLRVCREMRRRTPSRWQHIVRFVAVLGRLEPRGVIQRILLRACARILWRRRRRRCRRRRRRLRRRRRARRARCARRVRRRAARRGSRASAMPPGRRRMSDRRTPAYPVVAGTCPQRGRRAARRRVRRGRRCRQWQRWWGARRAWAVAARRAVARARP